VEPVYVTVLAARRRLAASMERARGNCVITTSRPGEETAPYVDVFFYLYSQTRQKRWVLPAALEESTMRLTTPADTATSRTSGSAATWILMLLV